MRLWLLVVLLSACEVANPAYDVATPSADANAMDGTLASDDALRTQGGAGGGQAGAGGAAFVDEDAGTTSKGGNQALVPDGSAETRIGAGDAGTDAGPTSGPILEFLFNEGSGTTVGDSSGSGNQGQAKCVASCSNGLPSWTRYNNILGLELAYYQVIQVNSSPSLKAVTGDFSLFMHARRLAQPGIRPLASSLTTDKTSTLFLFSFDDGHLSARVGNVRASDPQAAPGNTWMYLGVRRQGGTLALFRDGQMVASAPQSTQALSTTEPLLIGAAFLDQPFQTYADAVVDDLVLYNRALSNSEVDMLRQGSIPR